MDTNKLDQFVNQFWDKTVMPTITEYVEIPCKSPEFDQQWHENGHLQRAAELCKKWVQSLNIKGLEIELLSIDGRTPFIYIEIAGDAEKSVLFYGHIDKQPEGENWDADKAPFKAVVQDDKLYGRGSADDGYALFSALTSVAAVQAMGEPHATIKIIIEASEESGSPDLKTYMEHFKDRIGVPNLVIVLDSGCGNYEQLWCTTSLRGMVSGRLNIKILENGVHSGDGSGIVPSSFRILRQLLDRIEDRQTGALLPDYFYVDVPPQRMEEAKKVAAELGDTIFNRFSFVEGASPLSKNPTTLILNKAWRPSLSVTGIDGIPSTSNAGNVLRSYTNTKLSFRLPPTADAKSIKEKIKAELEKEPPYGAQVVFEVEDGSSGWSAPELSAWLQNSLESASHAFYGKEVMFVGEGWSIPLLAILNKQFPKSQFIVTGVLGPHSNAHGPNEFLHLPMVKNISKCMAKVLVDQMTP